jgi:hypothetical protein
LNVAKLAALDNERLTDLADQAQTLYASIDHSLPWVNDGRSFISHSPLHRSYKFHNINQFTLWFSVAAEIL